MTSPSPFVDYERHAERYRHGRSLPDDVLERWKAAVLPHLPRWSHGRANVLDLGAGTGIFARAWPTWAPAAVTALEPTPAMIREGRDAAPYARGLAEHLPFRDTAFDVVWASTALHHFADLDGAAGEIARVLRRDGRVLVRTHLPGRSEVTWHQAFPAAVRAGADARFPDLGRLGRAFGPHGFEVAHVENVTEETRTFAEAADWVARMRDADSLLTALTDDEVDAAIAALRAEPDRPSPVRLTLVVLTRS